MARVSSMRRYRVAPLHALETARRPRSASISVRVCSSIVRVLLDAPHQVARHALAEADPPRTSMCTRRGDTGEEHRRLSGGIAAADDDDLFAAAQLASMNVAL